MRITTKDGVDLKDIQPAQEFGKQLFTGEGEIAYASARSTFAYPMGWTKRGLRVWNLYSSRAVIPAREEKR